MEGKREAGDGSGSPPRPERRRTTATPDAEADADASLLGGARGRDTGRGWEVAPPKILQEYVFGHIDPVRDYSIGSATAMNNPAGLTAALTNVAGQQPSSHWNNNQEEHQDALPFLNSTSLIPPQQSLTQKDAVQTGQHGWAIGEQVNPSQATSAAAGATSVNNPASGAAAAMVPLPQRSINMQLSDREYQYFLSQMMRQNGGYLPQQPMAPGPPPRTIRPQPQMRLQHGGAPGRNEIILSRKQVELGWAALVQKRRECEVLTTQRNNLRRLLAEETARVGQLGEQFGDLCNEAVLLRQELKREQEKKLQQRGVAAAQAKAPKPDDEVTLKCRDCRVRDATILLKPCLHRSLCDLCFTRRRVCPYCRKYIEY